MAMAVFSTTDADPSGISPISTKPVQALAVVFPEFLITPLISRRPGVSWTLTRG